MSALDTVLECPQQLPEYPPSEIDDVTHRIGQNVAELVQDGATLQMGYLRVFLFNFANIIVLCDLSYLSMKK